MSIYREYYLYEILHRSMVLEIPASANKLQNITPEELLLFFHPISKSIIVNHLSWKLYKII